MAYDFTVVLRGYDRPQVDKTLADAELALASNSDVTRAAARDALTNARFAVVLRGYDRGEVDKHLSRLLQALSQAG